MSRKGFQNLYQVTFCHLESSKASSPCWLTLVMQHLHPIFLPLHMPHQPTPQGSACLKGPCSFSLQVFGHTGLSTGPYSLSGISGNETQKELLTRNWELTRFHAPISPHTASLHQTETDIAILEEAEKKGVMPLTEQY